MSGPGEPRRLIAIDELPESGVVAIETEEGRLAVGISNGAPFAVSDRCRHLFASLGEGEVADDGCLQCPRHAARYDVATGEMTRGPQGAAFALARGAVKAVASRTAPLARYEVSERDGVLYLGPRLG